MEERRLTADG
jgi:hypothetical protein